MSVKDNQTTRRVFLCESHHIGAPPPAYLCKALHIYEIKKVGGLSPSQFIKRLKQEPA